MISLKTLDDASAQDVFNHVVNHLLAQKEKSVNFRGDSMYHGLNGLKCAAGCLIANDEYSPEMECKTWHKLTYKSTIYKGNTEVVIPTKHFDLIDDLQKIHDHCEPNEWEEALRELCAKHMLKWEYVEKK